MSLRPVYKDDSGVRIYRSKKALFLNQTLPLRFKLVMIAIITTVLLLFRHYNDNPVMLWLVF